VSTKKDELPPKPNGAQVDAWDKNTPLPVDEVEVPFLKDIEFACGGRIQSDDHNGFKLRFSKQLSACWQTVMALEFFASQRLVTVWSPLFLMELPLRWTQTIKELLMENYMRLLNRSWRRKAKTHKAALPKAGRNTHNTQF
jgi:hypothetical protein